MASCDADVHMCMCLHVSSCVCVCVCMHMCSLPSLCEMEWRPGCPHELNTCSTADRPGADGIVVHDTKEKSHN